MPFVPAASAPKKVALAAFAFNLLLLGCNDRACGSIDATSYGQIGKILGKILFFCWL